MFVTSDHACSLLSHIFQFFNVLEFKTNYALWNSVFLTYYQ